MPQIKAFRGLRYNMAQIGSLSDCIAPPYDVVDGQLQAELYAKSPYNFIRLELTKPESGDTDPQAVYNRAASLFRQWCRDGVLQAEPDPAVYVYHQCFDYAGRTYTRRGFMARNIFLETTSRSLPSSVIRIPSPAASADGVRREAGLRHYLI